MHSDGIRVRGEVEVLVRDMVTGKVKYNFKKSNLIVTAGANELARIITSATGGTRPTSMGIGTSTTAPVAAQTDLTAALVKRNVSTSRSNNQITYSATFGTGVGTGTIQEGGLFNATGIGAGTMFARFLTGAFAKAGTDSLTLTWKVTFGTM